jgi:hypothetical protein
MPSLDHPRSANMRTTGSLHLKAVGVSLVLAACHVPPGAVEGGKGTQSKVLKFQLRPDPLAN